MPGMVAAMENGDADGVGLARPTAAEPGWCVRTGVHEPQPSASMFKTSRSDIANKILSGDVQSVVSSLLEGDFIAAGSASVTQMVQAALTKVSEVNGDLTHGIMDLSDSTAMGNYQAALRAYMQTVAEQLKQDLPVVVVLELDGRQKPLKVTA